MLSNVAMRILSPCILCLIVSLPTFLVGQGSQEPQARLLYEKIDLPATYSHTCLTVFPDGHFHMEQGSYWPQSGVHVFEGTMLPKEVNSLVALVDAQDFRNLPKTGEGMAKVAQGQVFSGVIHRGNEFQLFRRIGLEGSGTQHPKPLPQAIVPLLQWFQSSIKAIRQQKLAPLKDVRATNCGFPPPQ
jgi:hypothetical protein